MQTKLLYLTEFALLQSSAIVTAISEENGKAVIFLDQTIFYPQGGGQPYDQGSIISSNARFNVEEVRFADGAVKHIGNFENGSLSVGEAITCEVDVVRRMLHAHIHSAGHLVDKAIFELKLDWIPGKGYHFPNGPYNEYKGSLEGKDKEKIKTDIERLCNEYVTKGGKTEVLFMTREKMKEVCHYTPDFAEAKGELARIVVHGGYYMPCGGTPVADLSEIGHITIRKVKQEKENIRVGYEIDIT